jgi:PIN domain nuclease of toxin-antitoxin system
MGVELTGNERLSLRAAGAIEQAETVFVSSISFFEIG